MTICDTDGKDVEIKTLEENPTNETYYRVETMEDLLLYLKATGFESIDEFMIEVVQGRYQRSELIGNWFTFGGGRGGNYYFHILDVNDKGVRPHPSDIN